MRGFGSVLPCSRGLRARGRPLGVLPFHGGCAFGAGEAAAAAIDPLGLGFGLPLGCLLGGILDPLVVVEVVPQQVTWTETVKSSSLQVTSWR